MSHSARTDSLSNKYRPKTLKDVIGQEVPVTILKNSFLKNSLHPCYLFHGVSGGGKTSLARIIAAMDNCKNLIDGVDPCGSCDICRSIFSGKSSDVKEFDAASNRSVDDIRNMKERIWEHPLICKRKYFILDEIQSLGGIATEAALKMIEEPPPYVRFILCTTDLNSIIDTIQYRSLDLEFKPVSWQDIMSNLEKICKKENISYDESSIRIISKKSNSSVRNSIKILEKVMSFSDSNTISLESTNKVLSQIDESEYSKLISSILDLNLQKAINTCNDICNNSPNSEQIIIGLTDYLDKLLITRVCSSNSDNFGLSSDDIKKYEQISVKTRPLLISRFLGHICDLKKALDLNLNVFSFLKKWTIEAVVEVAKLRDEEKKNQQK